MNELPDADEQSKLKEQTYQADVKRRNRPYVRLDKQLARNCSKAEQRHQGIINAALQTIILKFFRKALSTCRKPTSLKQVEKDGLLLPGEPRRDGALCLHERQANWH